MLKHAKWIARNDSMEMRPAPLFRKGFTIQNEVASAKLYACGLGHGLYFLNGEK